MEALKAPFQNLGDKITNAKTDASSAMDKIAGRAQAAWNTSPLHKVLAGGDTTYDNRDSNLKSESSKPAPKGTPAKPKMPKYHKGTDYVPKTGPAVLKKGEAVLDTKEAAKHRAAKGKTMTKVNAMSGAQDALGGKSDKPKKEIKHIKTEKAKSGGYIHTHVHTHPEHHPDEQHVTPDQDGMVAHMMEHMGTPNPGEADADAGQSGVAAGAAGGAPSPAPAAAPQM